MYSFRNQIAFITGASSSIGIGRAIAEKLSELGAVVILADIHLDGALSVQESLVAKGRQVTVQSLDITDLKSIDLCVKQIKSQFGKIDILINNAGRSSGTKLLDINEDEYQKIFDTNMKGTFFMTQAIVPLMIKNQYGRIINIGSVSAKQGGGHFAGPHYAASKAAITGFTKALAKELAPYNITANVVVPGLVDTAMTRSVLIDEQTRIGMLENIPIKRVGNGADIAHGVAFLASKHASYVTGEEVNINGGLYV